MRAIFAALAGVTILAGSARAVGSPPAQPSQPSVGCFEVYEPSQAAQISQPILLNRCTGTSWVLVREPLADQKGNPTRSFTYEWHGLSVSNDTPVLAFTTSKDIQRMTGQ